MTALPVRTAIVATVALIVAVPFAGADRGIALYAYVLAIGALVLGVLVHEVRRALPTMIPLERRLRPPPQREQRIAQLETLTRRLSVGESSTFDLHYRLRPLLREIAVARLARRHGVDFTRSPERARSLLGEQLWEILRPERQPPEERFARGPSKRQLAALIKRLERL